MKICVICGYFFLWIRLTRVNLKNRTTTQSTSRRIAEKVTVHNPQQPSAENCPPVAGSTVLQGSLVDGEIAARTHVEDTDTVPAIDGIASTLQGDIC